MANRIIAIKEEFDPEFSEGELSFISLLRSYFNNGPYRFEQLHAFGMLNRLYYQDYIDDLIRKGIFERSPDHKFFKFTQEGWEAYVDLFHKQKAWEEGKTELSITEKPNFRVDASNKLALMKTLGNIYSLASIRLIIQEPYPLKNFILMLGDIEDSIEIKILTSEKQKDKAKLMSAKAALEELTRARKNTQVRINNKIHARKIIVDEAFTWQSTGSQSTNDSLIYTKVKELQKELGEFKKDWSEGVDL